MTDSAWHSDQILAYLYDRPKKVVALDTETDGLEVFDRSSKAIGLSIAFRDDDDNLISTYWGARHKVGQNIDKATAKKIRWVLETQRRPIVYANAQFDMTAMLTLGVDIRPNPFFDVLTTQNLINENWTNFRRGLDELAVYTLPEGDRKIVTWEWEDEFPLKVEKTTGWLNTTPEMMHDYAAVDAELTLKIFEVQIKTPAWKDLPKAVWTVKQDAIRTLLEMRLRGIKVNMPLVKELYAEGEAEKARIKEELGLNPASNKDMQELFINRLGLPILKTSEKTNAPSFDKSVMPEYDAMLERDDRQEAKLLKAYRGWNTAVGLLLRPYSALTSKEDGRLRTEYTTHQTVTGRLSSRNPNLQQISKDGGSPWNDRIKQCFEAREGYVLLSADYSQLELRLATAYSQEPALLQIFEEGRDVFTEMAEEMDWPRQRVKTFVYSVQYGGGVKRIMSAFGVTKREAEKLRRDFYRRYPYFRALEDRCKEMVAKDRRIKIWTGRYRHFQYENESYKAMNSLIQGGAADVVDRVMVHAMKNLDNEDCRLLLQVHDALVFEVREDLADEYAVKIQELMEDVNGICAPDLDEPLFPVKFAVEVSAW